MCGKLLRALLPLVFASQAFGLDIYRDALATGWDNWSWSATLKFNSSTPVHGGTKALQATYSAGWGGIYLNHAEMPAGQFSALRFWLHGGPQGGQPLQVAIYVAPGVGAPMNVAISAPAANTWAQHTIALSQFGNPDVIAGVVFQEGTGAGPFRTFSLDDVELVANTNPTPTPTPQAAPAIDVDAGGAGHAINPDIYGINFLDEATAAELDLPVRRWGGNSTTRYNYLLDTANHASDWYFENIPEDNANPGALPNGSSVDQFVEQDRRTGTKTILNMPLIGWTPKSRGFLGGFPVGKYGAQQSVDPYRTQFGNGVRTNGTMITGNDPTDTSVAIGPQYVKDWIAHLISRYGTAAQGGVAYYNLDNEPCLWNSTHRDVHPAGLSYDELLSRTLTYAAAIKQADPGAKTLGPVFWGWTAYFYSARDQEAGGAWWNNPLDRNAHGGKEMVAWYLEQLHAKHQQSGQRLLDYLDLHYYPQASGVSLAGAGNSATQALRLRSTRGLWDATYTEESWIAEPVRLIPRMKAWVAANYPGTLLAMTEYNWGAPEHINGALAQADVLGIFGREGLDLATLWAPPGANQPGMFAFRMFRNYDGAKSKFGERSLNATSGDEGKVAVYAARRERDRSNVMTILLINKTALTQMTSVTLSGVGTGYKTARRYQYSAANLGAIVRLGDVAVGAGEQGVGGKAGVEVNLPGNSMTLLELAPGSGARGWEMY